jgi:ferric-dicitrate binding protein FerR (iron transport regulator)
MPKSTTMQPVADRDSESDPALADLGERVVAARGRAVAGVGPEVGGRTGWSLSLRWGVAMVAIAAIIAFAFALRRSPALPGVAGELVAVERVSLRLGHRGVAVLEAGAGIVYRVGNHGAVEVDQQRGQVFYRVDRDGDFVVATPAGQVEAAPACFQVRVEADAVTVRVLEGLVRVVGASAVVDLGAGDELVTELLVRDP